MGAERFGLGRLIAVDRIGGDRGDRHRHVLQRFRRLARDNGDGVGVIGSGAGRFGRSIGGMGQTRQGQRSGGHTREERGAERRHDCP